MKKKYIKPNSEVIKISASENFDRNIEEKEIGIYSKEGEGTY